MNIIIDDRESAVIPFINIQKAKNLNITCEVKRINIGDYALCYGSNIKAIIERKTWRDLAASIRDGRKKNVNKLLKLREETKCKIIYLIEGNASPNANTSYGRIPYKILISHLNHLIFRDDIHIIYSKDQEYTAYKLFELCNNYLTLQEKENLETLENSENNIINKLLLTPNEQTGGFDAEPADAELTNTEPADAEPADAEPAEVDNNKSFNCNNLNDMYDCVNEILKKEPIDKLTEKQIKETDINMSLLSCIPGIGYKTAEILHSNNITLYKIYHKYINYEQLGIKKNKEECIESFKKNAKYNLDHNVKILSLIPQVSKKTAQLILTKTSLHNIFTQKKESYKLISEIKKTENRKIGKVAANNIIKELTE